MSERGRSSISEEDFERLQRDYTDATEQFAAMNEVLTALGRSSSDPDAVLDTVVQSARRLCHAAAGQIYLVDDDHFVLSSSVGLSPENGTMWSTQLRAAELASRSSSRS